MKYLNKLLLATVLFSAASCTEYDMKDFLAEEPESLVQLEYLKDYNALKTYVDRTANPNFKLGTGASLSEYNSKGLMYRLVNANYDEITMGYEMKHGAVVQADGKLALENINILIENAQKAGTTIYGHTLCWHANQNAKYLNGLIAPTVITGNSPARWDPLWSQDFENDNSTTAGSVYSNNANAVKGFTAVGGGMNGTGRAITISNASVRTNDWDCQIFFTFPNAVKTGDKLRLTMDIKSDVNTSYPTQAHTAPGAYKHWDFFGTLAATPVWTTYVKEITVASNQDGANTIAFNLGKAATTYYFDNAKVEIWNPNPGTSTVEKTTEEKKAIILDALDKWIKGMLTACKSYVKVWDVVNEPMSDYPDPSQLKTGVGKTLASDEFYWQDYLGKDYAVKAIQFARQYGNAEDKLFINDYGLESDDQKKCKGLIDYISYIESKGVKVDGIGTQMHVTYGITSLNSVKAMLTNLAATGKLIKISELDMGYRASGSATNLLTDSVKFAQAKEMSVFYHQIVKAYFDIVPPAQRYGITHWSPLDSPKSSSWRAQEPIGLWTEKYNRKPAYAGFADGLAGKAVPTN